jgi:SAM-dependent methyltransferase
VPHREGEESVQKEMESAPTMNLLDIIHRRPVPEPWAEGEKIPWDDPVFSRRMLEEHLSQAHDLASRRFAVIDRHVAWIHDHLLAARPTRILDLGCGPGLYASRLAALGHTCVGIDFAPASIAYAREQAEEAGLPCRYQLEDVRQASYGQGYRLVMFLYGEINVFQRADAAAILQKAYGALAPDGLLLLEPHTYEAVQGLGQASPRWYSADHGLWSAQPHICLQENFWDATREVTTERYFLVDAQTGEVTRHASSMQAYGNQGYRDLLREAGFGKVQFYPSLTGDPHEGQQALFAIVARKAGG